MLESLQLIVQAVNSASSLDEALDIIVRRVKKAMNVEVCSVYLTDMDSDVHTLMATDGLNPESVGKVRLARNEGLVGLVGKRQEPVNINDAFEHPNFRYLPETGEEKFRSFLGVPIIHYRRELGVLVVQHVDSRLFTNDEMAFLVTIAAQLAGAIVHAAASGDTEIKTGRQKRSPEFLQGAPGAPGVAIGTIVQLEPLADLDSVPDREIEDTAAEEHSFRQVVVSVQEELRSDAARLSGALPSDARALFEVHVMLLGDQGLIADVTERIRAGNWAPGALRDTIKQHARFFDDIEDIYLRARAEDIRDIGKRLLVRLQSIDVGKKEYPQQCILMGDEISMYQIADVPADQIAGIVSAKGSGVSHIAVLANGLGIPAVMGLGDLPVGRLDGHEIAVDGYNGRICIDPPPTIKHQFMRLVREEQRISAELEELRELPTETPDRHRIRLYVNSGLQADLSSAIDSGAEGVGLYRTEFSFMMRESFPGEDEQYQIYREVLESFSPRHVVMRTLDVGGDKALPYFPINEENPFLGWRGIRFTLDHPEIFLTQIRALLRANDGLQNLHLLLPMVSWVDEVDNALALVDRAWEELRQEGHHLAAPPVGVMIEVPAMLYQIEALLQRVDFLSIGTNDLIQYLLAVDRNNARVVGLYDSLHPAVLNVLIEVVERAHRLDKRVSLCGEMAGDPAAVILLIAMGVDVLSMSPAALLRAKGVIRRFTRARAQELLREALELEDARAIRALLNDELDEAGLGGLIRAGK